MHYIKRGYIGFIKKYFVVDLEIASVLFGP
jgi:hypothetical protein